MKKAVDPEIQATINSCREALARFEQAAAETAAAGPREVGHFKIEIDSKAQKMRIMFAEFEGAKPLMFMEMNAPYVYDFTAMILEGYDELEGIK